MTREQMQQWARENLRTTSDFYEAFVGLQDAVDESALPDTGWGDYVFRHTAKGLKKVAKEQKLRPQENPTPKRGSGRKKTKQNPKKVSVGRLVSSALK